MGEGNVSKWNVCMDEEGDGFKGTDEEISLDKKRGPYF